MSRYGRILPGGDYYVHVMSRVVNRDFVLGDREKAYFLELMRKLAAFCGIEVITHAILDNHWHCL